MSEIEAELVKLFKFKKTPGDYTDRQDYLEDIIQVLDKNKDNDKFDAVFDAMTEPAYDWLQEAVEAHNKKREIPDFPDAEPEEVEDLSEEAEAIAEVEVPVDGEEPEADPEVDEKTPEEAVEEEAAEGEQKAEEVVEPETGEVSEPDNEQPELDVVPAETTAKKPRKKPVKAGKYIKKKKGKPDVEPKNKPGHEPDYRKITGKKNRYGVTEGTKASLALKMLEKGATMRDINIELGDNYYVLLRRLVKEGHRVEKLENRVLKIFHKDDFGKKAKGK